MIRVFIADDHFVVRAGLMALLSDVSNLMVVGQAESGKNIMQVIRQTKPNVLMLDVQMPHFADAAGFVRQLTRDSPQVKVLILTGFNDEELMYDLITAGAKGYLLKGGEDDVTDAVCQVARGGHYFPECVKDRVMCWLSTPRQASIGETLTSREVEVLRLVTRGQCNQEIANTLSIAPNTARNYVSRIYKKLDIRDRSAAVLYGVKHGL